MTPDDEPLDLLDTPLPTEPTSGGVDDPYAYLSQVFAACRGGFTKFVPPITPEGLTVWAEALRGFTRDEVLAGVQQWVNTSRRVPTAADIRVCAQIVRGANAAKAASVERSIAIANGAMSTRGTKPGRAVCPGCQMHTPCVAFTRRPDGTVSARYHPCRCFAVSNPQHSVIVSEREVQREKIDLVRVNYASEAEAQDLLGSWMPKAFGEDPKTRREFDRVREMLQ